MSAISEFQSSASIPDSGDVDEAWLTAALRSAGFDVTVAHCSQAPVGNGQVGDTFRYTLGYDGPAEGAPTSIIGKHHSANADSRAIARQLGLYRNEFMFYRDLAAKTDAAMARPYFVVNDEDERFALLLEDLAPAAPADQLAGITPRQARLAVVEAAKLHAAHWSSLAEPTGDWLNRRPLAQGVAGPDELVAHWPLFEERYRDLVAPEHMQVAAAFVRQAHGWNRPLDLPRSLTHNDFRPDNLMFATAEGGKPVAIVDWQTLSYHYGILDIAYLLGGSFDGDQRYALEQELLPEYHETLCSLGVRDFSLDQCKEYYRHFTFAGLTVAIIASVTVKRTERGDRLFANMIARHCSHILDQDALQLLE